MRTGDWNQLALIRSDDRLQSKLNEMIVYDELVDQLPQVDLFGLFHYAEQTKARVRNLQLTGTWPAEIPDPLLELCVP